ncbi:MAG: hypothetical protein R6U46_01655 [Marinilabilia sp.]
MQSEKSPSIIPALENESRLRNNASNKDTMQMHDRWFFPDHAKLQFAGSTGFISAGVGYKFWDFYEPTLILGLLSENLGGSDVNVQTLSVKNSFNLTKQPWLKHFRPRAGLLVNWGITKKTFLKLPPHCPDRYYFQNKIHIAPFWGGEWHIPFETNHMNGAGLYFEFSALDAYLLEAIRTDYVSITDIWSLGLGITFYFK